MDEYISRREHDEFVKRMEDEHTRMNHRLVILEKIAEDNQKMTTNIEKLALNMKHMIEVQQDQGKRLDEFEKDRGSGWDSIKRGLFNAIGAAVGGAVVVAIATILMNT